MSKALKFCLILGMMVSALAWGVAEVRGQVACDVESCLQGNVACPSRQCGPYSSGRCENEIQDSDPLADFAAADGWCNSNCDNINNTCCEVFYEPGAFGFGQGYVANCYNVVTPPTATPTFPPPTPKPACVSVGVCDLNTAANECGTGCKESYDYIGSTTCLCVANDFTLACNQECIIASIGFHNECVPGCGLCEEVAGIARCVNPLTGGIAPQPTPPPEAIPPYDPCAGVEDKGACNQCVKNPSNPGAYTALGCIPAQPTSFAAEIIKILFGIAGGVAFLLMIYGAFICITSRGDPTKAQACRETITAAIVGLLMLLFSLLLVRIIFSPAGIIPNLVKGIW